VLDPGNVTTYVKQLRSEIAAGRLCGPRIFFTGPVMDGPTPVWPDISAAVATEAQIPHFLGVLKLAGVDFVKAYTGLSDGMVRAVADSARRHSLRVIADVGPRNGSLETARTGIAAFAHAGSQPMTHDGIRYMTENGTMSISTLAVYESFARRRFEDMSFLDQPLLRDVMPPSYREQLRTHGTTPMSQTDSALAQRLGGALATAMANVKRMVDAGIVVAAGTDAPYPGDFYGEGLHRELELLVEAGLTPLQAISAATRDAARFIGPDTDWGTLEPGKIADLLLVRGDPSTRIGDTRNVVTVIFGGRMVDRGALRYDPRTEPDFHPSPLRPH
jgi:imidazolonepropionase-like amidohydrolase